MWVSCVYSKYDMQHLYVTEQGVGQLHVEQQDEEHMYTEQQHYGSGIFSKKL